MWRVRIRKIFLQQYLPIAGIERHGLLKKDHHEANAAEQAARRAARK
jgi:hypothetical protein